MSDNFPQCPSIVTPRARLRGEGEPIALADQLRRILDRGQSGVVHLRGAAGSGKSTALSHLARIFEDRVTTLDAGELYRLETAARRGLVVAVGAEECGRSIDEVYLARWEKDQLVEYLVACYPSRCESVMSRVACDTDSDSLRGSPELWRVVLDAMAADPSIRYIATALRNRLAELMTPRARALAGNGAIRLLANGRTFVIATPDSHAQPARLVRHRAVQVILAGERVAELLSGSRDCDLPCLPIDVLAEASVLTRSSARMAERLEAAVSRVRMAC